jgi:cytochrome c
LDPASPAWSATRRRPSQASAIRRRCSASVIVWTRENLDRYVAAPAAVVKGTFMTFQGVPDARDRADLIAYLATTGTTGAKTP